MPREKKPTKGKKNLADIVAGAEALARGPESIRFIGEVVPSGRDDRVHFQLDDARLLGSVLIFRSEDILAQTPTETGQGHQLSALDVRVGAPMYVAAVTTSDRLAAGLLNGLARLEKLRADREGGVFANENDDDKTDFLKDPIELTLTQAKESTDPPRPTSPNTSVLDDPLELTIFQAKDATGPSSDATVPPEDKPQTSVLDDALDDDAPTSVLSDPIDPTFNSPSEMTGKDQDELVPRTDLFRDPIELSISLKDWSFRGLDDPDDPVPGDGDTPGGTTKPDIGPTNFIKDLKLPPKDPLSDFTVPLQDVQPRGRGSNEGTWTFFGIDDLTFKWLGADVKIPF